MFDLTTVKEHLRVEHDHEDVLILGYMAAARDFAESFLGRKLDDFEQLPPTVLSGLLLHVAMLYEDREGGFIDKNQQLKTIKLLYWPHRAVSV